MFSSQTTGVSTAEMKSQTSCTTSTMYSFAPMPSNGGISYVGSSSPATLQAPAAVRKADDAPLLLAPLQHRQVPTRPLFDARRAGVVVFLQPQQAEVPGVRTGEAGDFDVVPHQVVRASKACAALPSKNCFW